METERIIEGIIKKDDPPMDHQDYQEHPAHQGPNPAPDPRSHHNHQMQSILSDIDQFRSVSDLFALLGDPTRIRIFWLLCHREDCVMSLAELLGMSSPAVSHHLRSLRNTGLIVGRRDGKEVYYQAADTEVAALLHHMVEQVMSVTCPEEGERLTGYQDERELLAREVHEYLIAHLDRRLTIDELAREFHTNSTTLKATFKNVYGKPLAAHIKEHRMASAAALLRESDLSIFDVGRRVGYDSQSRFSEAFREYSGMLPSDYRSAPTVPLSPACSCAPHPSSHHRSDHHDEHE